MRKSIAFIFFLLAAFALLILATASCQQRGYKFTYRPYIAPPKPKKSQDYDRYLIKPKNKQ